MAAPQPQSRDISINALPLCVIIRDDHPSVNFFAYYLEYVIFHMPENMVLPALRWIVNNGLTGRKFLDFVQGDCHRSGLEMIRYLTMRLERERELRTLTAKDLQL